MSNLGDIRPDTGVTELGKPTGEAMSILLAEVLLPILERVNDSLDELERAVARIVEAPHG